jgi:hypothetical protein
MLHGKKILSLIISLSMLMVMMVPINALVSGNFTDLNGSWAKEAISHAVANGLLCGSGDEIMPNKELKRSEMAAILTHAFGASEKADISKYSDIPADSWYADYMAKAIKMGAFYSADGKVYPDKPMTREEAFTVLGNVLRLGTIDYSALANFSDKSEVSAWALRQVAALAKAGYIKGYGGKLHPHSTITRAEIAQVMDNIFKQYIKEPGTYTSVPEGSVMINVSGVTLKNVTVNGDLIIGDGVGDGHCELDAVKLKGRLIVRGSGEHTTVAGIASTAGEENSVTLLQDADGGTGQIVITNSAGTTVLNVANQTVQMFSAFQPPPPPAILSPQAIQQLYEPAISVLSPQPGQAPGQAQTPVQTPPALPPPAFADGPAVVICNPNNNTRVLGTGDTNMPTVVCEPGSRLSGDFTNVVVSGSVPLTGSTAAPTPPQPQQPDVQISGNVHNTFVSSTSQLSLAGGSFQNLIVGSEAQDTSVTVQSDAVVQYASANAQTTFTGTGTIHDVQAQADNVTVDTIGTNVTAGQGVTGVTAGGTPVTAGASVTVNAPTSTSSSSHSGSSGSSENPPVVTPPILSSNADLKSLSVSSGFLNPQFSRENTDYEVSVPSDVNNVSVTAEVYERAETIKINGEAVQNNVASDPIEISTGQNSVVIAVYAQDGTKKEYKIKLIKAVKPVSAELESGNIIRIQMDGDLTSFLADNAAFTVTLEPSVTFLVPSNVSIDGNYVFLEFSEDIPLTSDITSVTVSYKKTGENDLTNGALVSDFENFPITLLQ